MNDARVPGDLPEGFGKNSDWAGLIREVYETDPLVCPQCSGQIQVILFIHDPVVVRRILSRDPHP